uniref:Periaxin n=1 Tax=Pseudonaja textilis TaxID=8673 RepID=A0A670ZR96_PSETE
SWGKYSSATAIRRLLEMVVETEAGAGARGLSVVGGGKAGLFVKDVLKDSPAARVLSLQEGDQLLSARVYFDNIKYEDALQILKWAEPYKISFCLKRVVPSADVSRQPGATVFEVRGPKAKLAKLNIQGLSSLKRKKKKKKRRIVAQSLQGTEARPAAGKPEVAPVDVEFSFPTFSKLRKARSAGEVAVAETKRHRLKFPRLKVKDAVAAEARLATGLAKKPKEEAGEERERGFQAPQVALALPLPKVGAEEEEAASLEARPKGQSLLGSASQLGWPKVEAALPKGSASALETPPGLLQAGLKLPAAEVAAPKVDIDLALPRLECAAAPEAAPKREGFRVKVPKFGVSAEEAELKLPLMKAEQVLEDHLPQLGGAGKLPQVEVSLGKPGSPKADKTKGSIIQLPGLEISLREHPLESQEAAGAAGASQMKLPEVRVPSLDISAPKVQDIHLCKPAGEPAASSGRAKPKEAAEGAGIKFQMPQISLPKFDFPVKPAPSPPPVQVKMPKPEGDPGVKVSLPKAGDVSLLAMKVPGVQLPKVPRPELGISVEKPEVEVTPSPAPLSFPAAPVPVLDIQLPKVGVELDLMKHERGASEQGPKAQGVTREALSKDLQVEISLPKGAVSQPGLEPGMRSIEGPALAGMVAKFPKVDLAFEKQLAPRAEAGLIPEPESPGFRVPVPSVEIAGPGSKAEAAAGRPAGDTAVAELQQREGGLQRPQAPSIQVSAPTLELGIGLPMAGREEGVLQAAPGTGAKIKLPKVELAKLGKGQEEEAEVRLPKVDIALPKAWLPEVELPPAKVDLDLEGPEAKFKIPSMGLPKLSTLKVEAPELELDVGLDGGGVLPKVTVGTPSVKWPKCGASGSPGDGQGQEDLTRVLQLELKPPKFSGSTEVLGSEMGAKEGRLRVPPLPLGLGKLETEAGMGREESSIALPDVSFSGDQERGEEAEAAGATDLEGGLKIPKIGITVCGSEATKRGTEHAASPSQRGEGGGEPEGKKSVFKAPGLEISAPGLKAQAEEEVGGPHARQRDSLDLEGTGREGWKQTDGHSDTRKRPRVRIPTFGLFLPRVGLEAPGGLGGQEPEAKGGLLALGRPKEAEGSAGLLVGEEEDQAKAAKLKPRTPFGVSLSRPKGAAEFSGEAEEASSRLKMPKLGFSKVEGAAQLQGERGEVLLQDGASKLGKIPLPQVELLSPSKGAETDPELSLKLVKADEVKEETHRSATIATALKAAKFKPPRVALSGFKKHNGELAPEAVSEPGLQVGAAPLKAATKGEPSSKFRFPKLALSSRPQEVLEISKHQQDQGGPNFRLPAVAFSVESGSEEGAPPPGSP